MNERYWKVIVRYGHLGNGREVSIARFIRTGSNENILDAYEIVENMPGTKSRAVSQIVEIDGETYQGGKCSERDNFYLNNLMTYKKKSSAA